MDIGIISATTRPHLRWARRDSFLFSARELLDSAVRHLAEGDTAAALEAAYRGTLRTAGARCAASEVIAKRKRLPNNVWEKLALVDVEGKKQAQFFQRYSRLRSRVLSGAADAPGEETVREFIYAAEEFLAAVETAAGWRRGAEEAAA